mgnify:CR=1 FL=1
MAEVRQSSAGEIGAWDMLTYRLSRWVKSPTPYLMLVGFALFFGAWFLLFKSRATSASGGEYMAVRKDELNNWAPYGLAKPIPANLRNYLGMLDVEAGLGPLFMETAEAIQNIANQYKDDQKAFKKKMKELESEAWEDFLDMTISQAILWAANNIFPEESRSEIAACEPYFIGSH